MLQFHEIPSSDFAVHLHPSLPFFSWILIGFYFVNSSFLFFFEEEEEGKREFRFVSLMNHGVKLIFSGFAYFVFFLFLLQSLTFNDYV